MKPTTQPTPAPALSRLCLGGATFGREIDQAAAFMLMDHAAERGITLFDTAASYSAGASERIVGAWLATRRPDPGTLFVATKLYPPYTPETVDAVTSACAARLGVETIDVLYLHTWDAAVENASTLTALDRLVRERRVRALGASNFTAAQLGGAIALQTSLDLTPFRFLQNIHNFAVRGVDDAIRRLCADRGIAIVTYSPLGAGFLTGKHRTGVQAGSRFAIVPGHRNIYFQPEAERRLAQLAAVSARTGRSMAHLALGWALHQPGIASVLVGGRIPAHLEQAFTALTASEPAVLAELDVGHVV